MLSVFSVSNVDHYIRYQLQVNKKTDLSVQNDNSQCVRTVQLQKSANERMKKYIHATNLQTVPKTRIQWKD